MEHTRSTAILLGAHEFPGLASVRPNLALLESCNSFRRYLAAAAQELELRYSDVLDLFDSDEHPSAQIEKISGHLQSFLQRVGSNRANVYIYYAGHGVILDGPRKPFALAVKFTKEGRLNTTSLKMQDLASELRDVAYFTRRFLILDCCFAGLALEAFSEAQSGPGDTTTAALANSLAEQFQVGDADDPTMDTEEDPTRGTTLFCASDAGKVARSPSGMDTTLFTGALIDCLLPKAGEPRIVSVRSLSHGTYRNIRRKGYDVRPVVHSPNQADGDIADIAAFPIVLNRPKKQAPTERTGKPAEPLSPEVGRTDDERKTRENRELIDWGNVTESKRPANSDLIARTGLTATSGFVKRIAARGNVWISGFIAILTICLLLQFAVYFRVKIASSFSSVGATGRFIELACITLQCSPVEDIGQLLVKPSDLKQVDGPRVLELTMPIQNRGVLQSKFPNVELRLLDEKNNVSIQKVLSPTDYLDNSALIENGINPHTTVSAKIRLVLSSDAAPPDNFRVQIYFP